MPGLNAIAAQRTDEWASIKQYTFWSEQELYEAIRPLVLFNETAGERAKEIDVPQRTLARHPQMNLSATECKVCLHLGSKVEREKPRNPCRLICASSLWNCILSCL